MNITCGEIIFLKKSGLWVKIRHKWEKRLKLFFKIKYTYINFIIEKTYNKKENNNLNFHDLYLIANIEIFYLII